MNNTKYAVVFDTNSYRQFVTGKTTDETIKAIEELREAEEKKNIIAIGIMIVGVEMLGNLVEGEAGVNYKDCLNGVVALANHCNDKETNTLRITPHPFLHLSNSFFTVRPPSIEALVQNIGGVLNDFKSDIEVALEYHRRYNTFENVKNFLEAEEKTFANEITQLIEQVKQDVRRNDPQINEKKLRAETLKYIDKDPFASLMAKAIIYNVAEKLGVQLSPVEIDNRASSLSLDLPVAVGFYKWICSRIVSGNINMHSPASQKQRWNWLWDYQVSFVISSGLNNREVILVTSDQDIIKILGACGYQDKVLTISEYLNYVKQP